MSQHDSFSNNACSHPPPSSSEEEEVIIVDVSVLEENTNNNCVIHQKFQNDKTKVLDGDDNTVPKRKQAPSLKGSIKSTNPNVDPTFFNSSKSASNLLVFHDNPLVVSEERCFLEWRKISFPLGTNDSSLKIKDISGFVVPGKITALIGSSNCGKSTILNILSQRGDYKEFGGQVLINGKVVRNCTEKACVSLTSTQYKSLVSHVPKDFSTPHTVLTVREILNFTVKLKLTNIKSATTKCREERLEYLLKKYELKSKEHVAYSTLGGAEKKRVHIAVHNVLKHRVLLLEHPTDGMEMGEAVRFVRILKSVAMMGLGVVITSHKPSLQEMELYDYISILNKGNQLYFGPPNKLIPYFTQIGLRVDESNHNEVGFLFQLISLLQAETLEAITLEEELESKDRSELFSEEFVKHFEDFYLPMKNKEEVRYLKNDVNNFHYEPYYANFFYSVLILLARNYLSRLRNWKVEFLIPLLEKLLVSTFIGLLYFQIDPGNMALKGKIFTFLNLNISLTFTASLKNLINQIPMMTQERNSSIYRTSVFFISKTMEDLLETSVLSLLFGWIVYFMTGLRLEYDRVLSFGLIFATYHWTCVSFAQMLVSLIPIPPLLNLITPVLNIMFILTSGVYGFPNTEWLSWFKYLNYLFYGFKAMSINEFNMQLEIPQNTTWPSNYYTNGTYFLEKNYGYRDTPDMMWAYFAILTSFWIFCKIMSYLGLRLIYGKKSWIRVAKKILQSFKKKIINL